MPRPSFTFLVLLWISSYIPDSISDENLELQRYVPPRAEDEANQRFQQIMQGPELSKWKDGVEARQKANKKLDVKQEIEKLNITYVYQPDWPDQNKKLGAVSAVSYDKNGNVVVFHRVDRIWTGLTFDMMNNYQEREKGPISDNTVVAFNRKDGTVVYEWGKNLFYMPHGLTVDNEENTWVTDVALHQVFKFGPGGSNDKPLMILGVPFIPGNSNGKFCKPTAVAVLPNGDFFVADGYCNARILKYSKAGEIILTWGRNIFQGIAYDIAPKNFFSIPHALTLVKQPLELVCVADRENGRVQCFHSNNGTFHSQYHSQLVGDRLFSVDYSPVNGGQLFIVNGPTAELGPEDHYTEVRGYVMDLKTKEVLSKFGPNDSPFANPHDIAVSEDGDEIYVAELDPNKVHKFLSKKVAKNTIYMSASKPTATLGDSTENPQSITIAKVQPGSTVLLVVSLVVIFALLTFGLALLISRRRKRGCFPFGVRNRRHAWDFPTVKPAEGFKLGNLLDRKRGFEKLDQTASDEEPDATTNMLSAQFA